MSELVNALDAAAEAVAGAQAILVAAGAGMGVDSGLPDFRGTGGFWRAYPPIARLGLRFEEMANPSWFLRDPELAWGFYGHRLLLYRRTEPHPGFAILRRWTRQKGDRAFVFTSNVDGHFQRAGFGDDRVVECHGSLSHLQCVRPCKEAIWSAESLRLEVDEASLRAAPPLPTCPACGQLARPNVLMFGDWSWVPHRTQGQSDRLASWLARMSDGRLAIVELGAGTAVPSVRHMAERVAREMDGSLIRINPREPQAPSSGIELPMGALEALREIDRRLEAAP